MNDLLMAVYRVDGSTEGSFYGATEYSIEDIRKEVATYGKNAVLLGVFSASSDSEDLLNATDVSIISKLY